MRLADSNESMEHFVTFAGFLAVMASILSIAPAGVARAQGQHSIYEMSLAPLAVSVDGDRGGNIAEYIIRTEEYRSALTRVSFAGRCDSACTLLLNLEPEQICVRQNAYFRFHAPIANSRRAERMAMEIMMERYPDWVKGWIFRHGGLTHRLITMEYAYASQFVQPCTELALR